MNQDQSGRDQTENVLATHPLDPTTLIGGANDKRNGPVRCGYYVSTDGGQSWTDGILPQDLATYPLQGDPVVAFCANGTAVFTCLGYTYDGLHGPSGVFSYLTTDGGGSWEGPYTVVSRSDGLPASPFTDKEWATCDRTPGSPFANRAYASWSDVLNDDFEAVIQLGHSDDGMTWSESVRVSDPGRLGQGSVVTVDREGTVFVAWLDNIWGPDTRIGFDRSSDGGQTFGLDRFPSSVDWEPNPRFGGNGPDFREVAFPTMDADRSDGSGSGTLYIAWSDDRNGDADILMIRSSDGGSTWSAPLRVNDDPVTNGADQFYPWLAVDPKGRVIVTFVDRRRFPGDRPYEIWGAISRDGGQSFDTNFLISDMAGRANEEVSFIGDYTGLAATEDRLYPFWTDVRAGSETDLYIDLHPNIFDYDEVRGVRWLDRDTIDFEAQDDRFGADLDYDVVGGLLSELRADRDYTRASCTAAAWPAPPYLDSRVPPTSDGYYFMIRSHGPAGVGTYGDGSAARPNVRDPLDEGTPLCP